MIPVRLARDSIYESEWVNLYADRVRFEDGTVLDRHYVLHFDYESVGVVIQNEAGEILLIRSNRYITQRLEWEIPAGRIESGESVMEAAKRETQEETGCEIADIKLLGKYNPDNGISDMSFNICSARAFRQGTGFDHNEVAQTQWVPVDRVKQMIRDNDIHCGLSITGLLWHMLDM